MSLVIASGPSVSNFNRKQLRKCAAQNFTFAVNDSMFHFPFDIGVALDSDWIIANHTKLSKLNKPIVTRDWGCLRESPLTLIRMPMEAIEIARLSGMAAAKISDSLAAAVNHASWVVGLDATDDGHWYGPANTCLPISQAASLDDYENLRCTHTINLSTTGRIKCWPINDRLPFCDKLSKSDRFSATMYIGSYINGLMYRGITK